MKKISLGFLFPLIGLVLFVIILDRQLFQMPALGRFLNPFGGVIQNEKNQGIDKTINEIGRDIEVFFDDRDVPHVFSKNQADLFFAQGYVTASDRLWQMDFISYAAAGRLSEIFGKDYLPYDRLQRRTGMLSSAKESLIMIESNIETKNALDNYTEGVNAYIHQLSKKNIPFEYKLMDYELEPWTNLKSVLVMKNVSALLSGYEEDLGSSQMLLALGEEDFKKLYPEYKLNNSLDSSFSLNRLLDSLPYEKYIDYSFLELNQMVTQSSFNPRLGSNCWAISPSKSKTGSAILCNDPHLNLSFPSIWYEMQLSSNETNVYGYTIPGTPGVIIGYNDHIAWGVTNGATDVKDWYKLELKEDYSEYKLDEKWKKTNISIEKISIRDQEPFYDTIYYTVHGPIVMDKNYNQNPEFQNYSLKWTLHEPSNEFLAFIRLNKAANYLEFKDAIKNYKCPVQNFTYADVDGDIAIHHQGEIYKKLWIGQGRFVLDGTKSSHIAKDVLTSELPYSYNPPSGFVYSANNNPFQQIDSLYINGYYSEIRANKINQYLSTSEKLSIDDMKMMQTDNTNRLAELSMPIFLELLGDVDNLEVQKFRDWDCKYDKDSELAFFFEEWIELIKFYTWDELLRYEFYLSHPDDLVLLELMKNEPENTFFDILETNQKENAADIVVKSFLEISDSYKNKSLIEWGDTNKIQITHLAFIEALGKYEIKSGGHPEALNALSENWGPSLRMIVEMSEKPKGYGIYAGGQSGNPASKGYDNFINDWLEGHYYELNFYSSRNEAKKGANYIWTVK